MDGEWLTQSLLKEVKLEIKDSPDRLLYKRMVLHWLFFRGFGLIKGKHVLPFLLLSNMCTFAGV
jgi:hypothetical protein